MLYSVLAKKISGTQSKGLFRTRRIIEGPQGIQVDIDGQSLVNFSSNDYLGLAAHPAVVHALKVGANKYGVGSGSAHLICGHCKAHHWLEEELAEFTGRDRALLFSTGYMANLGVISALFGRNDFVFEDRLNHASLLDGGLLSRAKIKRYKHVDVDALETMLLHSEAKNKLVVSDGVFSMDGDIAPIEALVQLTKKTKAWMLIDDAHGIGVLGKYGGGSLEQLRLDQHDVPILVGTLGKAIGTFGAFVAGGELLIETLIQESRPYIYTTALPPSIAEATRVSLKLVRKEAWRRDKLKQLIKRFRTGARQLGLPLLDSATPIQPILIGDSRRAKQAGDKLMEYGFLIGAIRPPTVPVGSARLRVTLSALHENEHIDRLLQALDDIDLMTPIEAG